jgi:hypothetical protein
MSLLIKLFSLSSKKSNQLFKRETLSPLQFHYIQNSFPVIRKGTQLNQKDKNNLFFFKADNLGK